MWGLAPLTRPAWMVLSAHFQARKLNSCRQLDILAGDRYKGIQNLPFKTPMHGGGLHDQGWVALAAEAGHAEAGLCTCPDRGSHLEQVDVPPRLRAKALCGQAVVCGNLVQQASLV